MVTGAHRHPGASHPSMSTPRVSGLQTITITGPVKRRTNQPANLPPRKNTPRAKQKPGLEITGKPRLNGRTNAGLVLAVGHPLQTKTKGNWGNNDNTPGREVAGKHPINGPGKRGKM